MMKAQQLAIDGMAYPLPLVTRQKASSPDPDSDSDSEDNTPVIEEQSGAEKAKGER